MHGRRSSKEDSRFVHCRARFGLDEGFRILSRNPRNPLCPLCMCWLSRPLHNLDSMTGLILRNLRDAGVNPAGRTSRIDRTACTVYRCTTTIDRVPGKNQQFLRG